VAVIYYRKPRLTIFDYTKPNYTWIYNSTKGSILLVALFHGSGNIVGAFIPGVSPVAYALVNCVVAISLIAVLGKVNLSSRERVRAH
jgi:uncharacterized protein